MNPGWILAGLAATSHSLSKAAPVFAEKIADAITGLAAPYQLKRMAQAQAEVTVIQKEAEASGNIVALELYERAGYRSTAEEVKRQFNIEAVTKGAIPLLRDDANPQNMDDDWIAHFFDKSRLTSDTEMQSLWSRILAGEANAPGTFSKRTVNLVSEISKSEAEAFTKVCGFLCSNLLLIFNYDDPIYKNAGVSSSQISQLEHAGLVNQSQSIGYQLEQLPPYVRLPYFDFSFQLSLPEESNNSLDVGNVRLTQAGRELSGICGAEIVPEFLKFIAQHWCNFGVVTLPISVPPIYPTSLMIANRIPVPKQVSVF